MRTSLWLCLFLAVAAPAFAQSSVRPVGVTPDDEVTAQAAKKLYGFELDYSIYDGSSLNPYSYTNTLTQYFEPAWQFGRLYLKGTRFKNMSIVGRFALTRPLAGYDPGFYGSGSAQPPPGECSNLTPSSNGTVNPGSVPRCPTTQDYRWDYGDVWLTLRDPNIYTIPAIDVKVNPSLRVVIPTSLESRYQSMLLSTTVFGGLSRGFLDNKVKLSYTLGFTKYFFQYKQPGQSSTGDQVSGGLPGNPSYDANAATANLAALQNDPSRVGPIGGYNPDFGFMHIFSADYGLTDKLSLAAIYILLDTYSYSSDCSPMNVNGTMTDPCANANTVAQTSNGVGTAGRKIADTQVLWLAASYQVNDWLGVTLSWINWAPLRKPDNSWRQPFISTNYDAFTSVNVGATVSIDKLGLKAL